MKLSENESTKIIGGAITVNSTFINAVARIINTVLDLGRTVGSAISRIKNKNYC